MRARWHLVGVGAAAVTASALSCGIRRRGHHHELHAEIGLAEAQPYRPGGHVTLTGTGFVSDGGVTSVTVGGIPAVDVQVGSDNTIYIMVPKGAQTGPIVVTTKAGSATTANLNSAATCTPIGEISLPNNIFTVLPCSGQSPNTTSVTAPVRATITSFTPTSAKSGAKVTITGGHFVGTTAVRFAGVEAVFKVVSGTKIVATVPASAKSGKITITNAAGRSLNKASFTKL